MLLDQASPEVRRSWRTDWLECIRELADPELQRSRWLDPGNGNPHWSFAEFVSSYFDDLNLAEGYTWAVEHGLVTADEATAAAALHTRFDRYRSPGGDDLDDRAVLADPQWAVVVEAAKQAKAWLLPLLEPAEQRILAGLG